MIHRFETIDSTNTFAKALAERGAPDGTIVIAQQQTGGRGRLGRSFHSPAGKGLYLSMVLRPPCAPGELMHLTCAAAVAACNAIEQAAGLRPGIKWTNDIVHGQKKLGGILTELGFYGDKLDYAVIGIGINCTHSLQDFPPELRTMAASLSMVCGKPVESSALEGHLIAALQSISKALLQDKAAIMAQYRRDCITLGKEISIHQGDTLRHGTAIDLDENGGLTIRLNDGSTETVAFGEVSVRGMYGYL